MIEIIKRAFDGGDSFEEWGHILGVLMIVHRSNINKISEIIIKLQSDIIEELIIRCPKYDNFERVKKELLEKILLSEYYLLVELL